MAVWSFWQRVFIASLNRTGALKEKNVKKLAPLYKDEKNVGIFIPTTGQPRSFRARLRNIGRDVLTTMQLTVEINW